MSLYLGFALFVGAIGWLFLKGRPLSKFLKTVLAEANIEDSLWQLRGGLDQSDKPGLYWTCTNQFIRTIPSCKVLAARHLNLVLPQFDWKLARDQDREFWVATRWPEDLPCENGVRDPDRLGFSVHGLSIDNTYIEYPGPETLENRVRLTVEPSSWLSTTDDDWERMTWKSSGLAVAAIAGRKGVDWVTLYIDFDVAGIERRLTEEKKENMHWDAAAFLIGSILIFWGLLSLK